MSNLSKVIIIVGPTASGKTALSLKLAKKFNGEIISADSCQIYRGMDIGTAKPLISPARRRRRRADAKSSAPSHDGAQFVISHGIPHHLIDIRNPNREYTLAHFKKDAVRAVKHIQNRGKIPFIVGGTGLYISALVNNLNIPKVKPNWKLRAKLEKLAQKQGLAPLLHKLIKLDPEATFIVDPRNGRRIIRALEIALTTRKPLSKQRTAGPRLFDFLVLGIDVPQEQLKRKIYLRAKQMIKLGLVKEVKNLIKKYGAGQKAFDAIGYREIIQHLKKELPLPETLALMSRNTWRFAKRQSTWFRRLSAVWIRNQKQAESAIKRFLKN